MVLFLTHILLSLFLRLPQPVEPGSCIYIPMEQGSPVIPPGIEFIEEFRTLSYSYESTWWVRGEAVIGRTESRVLPNRVGPRNWEERIDFLFWDQVVNDKSGAGTFIFNSMFRISDDGFKPHPPPHKTLTHGNCNVCRNGGKAVAIYWTPAQRTSRQ
jgi:hypothetical protein